MSLDILIPHYGDPNGLAESLRSISSQTWTGDIRLVIVDDGSPVKAFRTVNTLAEAQPFPVIVERNSSNRGRPYTRNRLLDNVDSDYVAWLDAGDIWYPEKIARQFEHINRLRFAGEDISQIWVTCNYDWEQEGARRRCVRQDVGGDQLKNLFLGQRLRAYLWTLLGPAGTFRAIGWFDERLPRLQDLDYFIRFVRAGGTITNVRYGKALCRYHKSDVGRCAREIRSCNRKIFRKNQTTLQQYGRGFLAIIQYNAETLSARFAKNNGDTLTRMYYILRAFAVHPMRGLDLVRRWAVAQVKG